MCGMDFISQEAYIDEYFRSLVHRKYVLNMLQTIGREALGLLKELRASCNRGLKGPES